MKSYIHLLQQFLAIAGYDSTHLRAGDTDLVNLKEGEELLCIFNDEGSDDLFLIFSDDDVILTFGEWADKIQGNDLKTFEYAMDIVLEILKGNYYVVEIRLDDAEINLLVSEETSQILNTYIPRGASVLASMSALDFVNGLDFSEVYVNEVRWTEDDDEEEDEFYWWDDQDEMTPEEWAEEEADEQECGCGCHGHHHHHGEGEAGCHHHHEEDIEDEIVADESETISAESDE